MADTPLRTRLLRLAVQNPGLREKLAGVLRASGGLTRQEEKALREASQGNTSVVQQPPIVIQQPPVIVQQEAPAPAPAPAPVAVPMMMPLPPIAPAVQPQVPMAPMTWPTAPPTESANAMMTGVPETAEAPPAFGAMLVTERTQKGFETDLVPEMNRMLASGKTREQVAQEVIAMLRESFSKKDALYNILIRHQSTFESDHAYRESLERLVGVWANSTADSGV